jgi:hypothetical protein
MSTQLLLAYSGKLKADENIHLREALYLCWRQRVACNLYRPFSVYRLELEKSCFKCGKQTLDSEGLVFTNLCSSKIVGLLESRATNRVDLGTRT